VERHGSGVERLLRDVEWAIAHRLRADELVPMLEKLARRAQRGSAPWLLATCRLAELVVEKAPWRAATLARAALAHRDDDGAWAVLGLAHTLLGHYRCARAAYRRALDLAPECPGYQHNLGHLLDVAFDRPSDALPLLFAAHRAHPSEPEIATSLAHALVRAHRRRDAARVLKRALRASDEQVESTLDEWLGSTQPGGPPSAARPAELGRPAARRRR
jgi:uncharacterized protein HemY